MQRLGKIGIVLLVLAYAGQALVASALPCRGMGSGNDPSATAVLAGMPGMAHAGHRMSRHMDTDTTAAPAAAGDTCCDHCCDAGMCAGHHCQGAAGLPQNRLVGGHGYAAPFLTLSEFSVPDNPVDLLFRPPISR